MTKPVDIAELAFTVEDLLRPLSCKTEGFGERPHELDYLRNVIVVFAVFGTGLGVKEVVAGN